MGSFIKTRKEKIGLIIILLCGLLALIVLSNLDPIPQDVSYHDFSDTSSFLCVPNTCNVVSNLPFLIVGILGISGVSKRGGLKIINQNRSAYFALFFGVALVAFGSGYYHLWPDNHTLVWDRLPMAIAFMGLVSIVIGEFISVNLSRVVLLPLLILGLFSVLYWHFTEASGVGDLRPYLFVQFFPIVAIPIVLLFFTSRYTHNSFYWWLIAAYFIAKLFEHFDQQVYDILVVLSGHSLKHISAAVGLYILIRGYRKREEG